MVMGYRDMTFCGYKDCKKFKDCHRALNKKVEAGAKRWWGKDGAPIIQFAEHPECFEEKK